MKTVYGVSYKNTIDRDSMYVLDFEGDMDAAMEWLRTEEYQFRTREIVSKTGAIKLAGKSKVVDALPIWKLWGPQYSSRS